MTRYASGSLLLPPSVFPWCVTYLSRIQARTEAGGDTVSHDVDEVGYKLPDLQPFDHLKRDGPDAQNPETVPGKGFGLRQFCPTVRAEPGFRTIPVHSWGSPPAVFRGILPGASKILSPKARAIYFRKCRDLRGSRSTAGAARSAVTFQERCTWTKERSWISLLKAYMRGGT